MADPVGPGNSVKDIDKIVVALKRGAQLLKYGRKGKPKFCPFRLSNDESSLIWHSSGGGEKVLKLASIIKIVPGQRTGVFQRYSGRGKDHLSFSLIYESGKRSLDLICKDKIEAEVWFAGLQALINASGQAGRSKIDGWSGNADDQGASSLTQFVDDGLGIGSSLRLSDSSFSTATPRYSTSPERSSSIWSSFDATATTTMQGNTRLSSSDILRASVSSTASSHGSGGGGRDDYDSLGDVYLWGQIFSDTGDDELLHSPFDPSNRRTDVLLPKAMESNNTSVLDVHYVACGVRHVALVTRHGEVFTWGEESGGRLGHGIEADSTQPRLVETLSTITCDLVACGEFHTCAINLAGELYTWGDGYYHYGILGHGNEIPVSQCVPKRVSGALETLHVSHVSCGVWHTALITSSGKLFTFGDGAFGVLGHGDKESCLSPREVESLTSKTIAVACGVWHTAAVVEVAELMELNKSSLPSGKLFTWGDGGKYKLGHGDNNPRYVPTCVSYLIDHNFNKIACGHSLTIGSTIAGRIFSMGSSDNGQLGNPYSDGKIPCLVEDKLVGEWVGEIACGSHHVVVLTMKNEVYTWGKGDNGRLGHGDRKDRNTPTLVDALKDTVVKSITCGANFTVAICQHKRVSGVEQSQCSSCRLAFGFTRKRHNCYNCGFVFCHSCSSKKALKAAMSPNPNKPYRVCDSCHVKLSKMSDSKKVYAAKTLNPPGKTTRATTPPGKSSTFFPGKTTTGVSSSSSRPTTPVPTTPRQSSSSFSSFSSTMDESIVESLKKANDEIERLQVQVENLRKVCELQEQEVLNSELKAQKATAYALDESTKSKAAKKVMKSLAAELKDLAEKLPLASMVPKKINDSTNGFEPNQAQKQNNDDDRGNVQIPSENEQTGDVEWMEQYEPGVYVELIGLEDGTRDLKRVRFSRRRFAENQAQTWWTNNHEKVYMKYNIRPSDKASELPL